MIGCRLVVVSFFSGYLGSVRVRVGWGRRVHWGHNNFFPFVCMPGNTSHRSDRPKL
jgi:hypothetical protein